VSSQILFGLLSIGLIFGRGKSSWHRSNSVPEGDIQQEDADMED